MMMKKLIFKTGLYVFLILISMECIVRISYLSKDNPTRFVDKFKVEKWVPNQEGYSVTGNRRQNFTKYHINKSGFNSYREFNPKKNRVEVALVGDSFIEGFHQPYYNSIGYKIENKIDDIEVYEYGYAGYDLADQLHMIDVYKPTFNLIDYVFIGVRFENDLLRGEYKVISDRMKFESPIYKNLRKSKLIVYSQNIGILDPIRNLAGRLSSVGKEKTNTNRVSIIKTPDKIKKMHLKYIDNFKKLVNIYGFDKERFVLLIDENKTPVIFLDYLKNNNYKYVDFSSTINSSKKPTTLIYDKHWNNHGRNLIANLISDYILKKLNKM